MCKSGQQNHTEQNVSKIIKKYSLWKIAIICICGNLTYADMFLVLEVHWFVFKTSGLFAKHFIVIG